MLRKIQNIVIITSITLILTSCFPDNIKEEMEKMTESMLIMSIDNDIKNTIAHIEVYRLRNGNYPVSLDSLTYFPKFQTSDFSKFDYQCLDTGYIFNLSAKLDSSSISKLRYTDDFFQGLGVKESNLWLRGKPLSEED